MKYMTIKETTNDTHKKKIGGKSFDRVARDARCVLRVGILLGSGFVKEDRKEVDNAGEEE